LPLPALHRLTKHLRPWLFLPVARIKSQTNVAQERTPQSGNGEVLSIYCYQEDDYCLLHKMGADSKIAGSALVFLTNLLHIACNKAMLD
jgi:hypothetical protein